MLPATLYKQGLQADGGPATGCAEMEACGVPLVGGMAVLCAPRRTARGLLWVEGTLVSHSGLAGEMIPSVAREDIMLAQAAQGAGFCAQEPPVRGHRVL